ncbi:MAG: hypothetical protein JO097_12025 [Acidobacteriaceae bacterium]|nr:hypothetical protein [Acidobacteriaceae bacterium]MBV9294401.1 hypothetical protein [Acidobacteriaceae bacterium]MBV9766126.1 hypothetical protein [Acidobacteriaceae bacterium]
MLRFNHHSIPELMEQDTETLAAIEEGIAQLDRGEGIPLEELRKELADRGNRQP